MREIEIDGKRVQVVTMSDIAPNGMEELRELCKSAKPSELPSWNRQPSSGGVPLMPCNACGLPILDSETPVPTEDGPVHEHCADPADAMAAGAWDPSEDYEHGDL